MTPQVLAPAAATWGRARRWFTLDAGETVRCTFSHKPAAGPHTGGLGSGSSTDQGDEDADGMPGDATNPFDDPDRDFADFPLPTELPPDAGSYTVPKPGPWVATSPADQMDCRITSLDIPASPPETGTLEVLDGGRTLVGSSLRDDQAAPVTGSADAEIIGRYTGAVDGTVQRVPIRINYVWRVVTDEYIVGYLTSSFTSEGVTCRIYRPHELTYAGQE